MIDKENEVAENVENKSVGSVENEFVPEDFDAEQEEKFYEGLHKILENLKVEVYMNKSSAGEESFLLSNIDHSREYHRYKVTEPDNEQLLNIMIDLDSVKKGLCVFLCINKKDAKNESSISYDSPRRGCLYRIEMSEHKNEEDWLHTNSTSEITPEK